MKRNGQFKEFRTTTLVKREEGGTTNAIPDATFEELGRQFYNGTLLLKKWNLVCRFLYSGRD